MKAETAAKLKAINAKFYSQAAAEFSNSRQYPWAGWERSWSLLKNTPESVLDLGCGNGRYYKFLQRKLNSFSYLGIDSSQELLNFAAAQNPQAEFLLLDLTQPLKLERTFDLIVAFAMLHHIPDIKVRKELLSSAFNLINSGGVLIFSLWMFLDFPRLKSKVVDWHGHISDQLLEAGDYLLSWGKDPISLRYCHYFDETEQAELLKDIDYKKLETFFADGENKKLNKYFLLFK